MNRKAMTDRMIVEIVMKYKDSLLEEGLSKDRLENRINHILKRFMKQTGRDVDAIQVVKKDGKYKLKLEIK